MLRDNCLAVDLEWLKGYNILLASLYGQKDGKEVRKTMTFGRTKQKPFDVDGCDIVFFVAGADIALLRPYLKGNYETFELSTMTKLAFNKAKKYEHGLKVGDMLLKGSLKEYSEFYLGHGMVYKEDKALRSVFEYTDRAQVSDEQMVMLKRRNDEDARITYKVARKIDELPKSPAAQLFYTRERAHSMAMDAEAWYHAVLKHGIPLNEEAAAIINNPLERAKIFEKACAETKDIYYVKDGNIHYKQRAFELFCDTLGLTKIRSNAVYADGGWAHKHGYQNLKDIMEKSDDKALQAAVSPFYTAEALRYYGNEKRVKYFNQPKIYPLEIVYGQQAGRCGYTGDAVINLGGIFRAMVKPPEGYALWSADIKSEEPLLAAHFFNDDVLMEWLTNGRDLYMQVVELAWGRPYQDDFKKDDADRSTAKLLFLAWLYGIGAGKLQTYLTVDRLRAQELRSALDRIFWQSLNSQRAFLAEAMTNGYVSLPLSGYPLYVDEDSNPRQIVNAIIQGTGADLLRTCVKEIGEEHHIVSTLFDGMYGLCRLEDVDWAPQAAAEAIRKSFARQIDLPWIVELQTDALYAHRNDGAKRPYFIEGLYEKSKYIPMVEKVWGEHSHLMFGGPL